MAVPIAAFVALVGSSAFAAQNWWTAPIMLIPLAFAIYGLRSGVDVNTTGLRVRSALASRLIPWTGVEGFDSTRRRVAVELRSGQAIRLPAVSPADLPRLLTAGGQDFSTGDSKESPA